MSKPDPTAADIARLRDASDWVQRLNESNDQELADQWMEWCRSDPLNLAVFEQMQRLWDGFPQARNADLHSHHVTTRFSSRNRIFTIAASVMLLIGIVGWFALHYPQSQVLDTAIGEQRRITLADGSHVDLAPDSRVSTSITLTRRDVRLERGQAFFAVAHEAMRPFIVRVKGLTVTAIGTAFDVRIGPSSTVVTVSEGRVTVMPATNEIGVGPSIGSDTVRAEVGQQVTLSETAHRLSVATVDPKIAGSWRSGTLQFVGEPLEDVVGEVNRYSARQIAVTPAFQQTRFTGTISPSNVGDWLKALEQIYDVEVIQEGANGILIQSRAGRGSS